MSFKEDIDLKTNIYKLNKNELERIILCLDKKPKLTQKEEEIYCTANKAWEKNFFQNKLVLGEMK